MLDVPVQTLINLSHAQSQQVDTIVQAPQFKRPRLSSSTPDAPQERYEDQPDGAVVAQRPYSIPPGGLTTVTLSISNCMGNLFCRPFERNDYTSPLTAPVHFGYEPSRPYDESKSAVCEQPFNTPSSAPSETPQPASMFTTGPMDNPQISYLPYYPAMQPAPQGTLTVQPPQAEEMVYQPMDPLIGQDSMMHVTNPETAVIPVNASGITGSGHSIGPHALGHPAALVPAGSGPGGTQHGPPTPHQSFNDNTPYINSTADPSYSFVRRTQGAKRGPFKNNAAREETAQTRRIGSCIRCRMQRIRCYINEDDEKGPCLTCAKVGSSKVWRLPCLRYKITDIQLFKPGKQVEGCEWTRRWTEGVVDNIANWESMDIRFIHVSEGFSSKFVELTVRKFIPQDGDRLERSWVGPDGSKRSVSIPPYAICDTHKAKEQYQKYIDDIIIDCFNAVLGPSNELLQRTYRIALARSVNASISEKERKLLQTTLRLWISIRLTTRSAIIVGEETLGMPRNILDETSPLAGKIPLPPVMGAQIDLILVNQIQKQWRKDALEMLRDMVQNNKQKTWMTTYLVTYMLLHNTALITAHDASYARKHGIPRRFAREAMVGKYHEGANVLLAYWHYCNKSVYPFSKQCKDSEFQQLASLDEAAMQFIRATRDIVHQKKAQWNKVQREENSEYDYYFISQLYEENWKPRESLPVGGGPRIREEHL